MNLKQILIRKQTLMQSAAMTSLQGTGPHRINKQGLCQQVEMEVDVAAES